MKRVKLAALHARRVQRLKCVYDGVLGEFIVVAEVIYLSLAAGDCWVGVRGRETGIEGGGRARKGTTRMA